MNNVGIVFPFKPLAFKVERIGGCVQAWAGLDGGRGGAFDVVKIAIVLVQIVLGLIAIELLASRIVFKMHVSTSLDVLSIGVIIELVGPDLHVRRLDADMAAKMAPGAFLALVLGKNRYLLGIFRSIGPDWQDFLVHIGADLSGLSWCGR